MYIDCPTEATSTLKLPVLCYEYKDSGGFTYVTADALMLSGACVQDVTVEVDSSGDQCTIKQQIPETFLAPGRVAVEDVHRKKRSVATKSTALASAVTDLRKNVPKNNNNRLCMTFTFPLPVTCKTHFPRKPFIGLYPNDYKNLRADESNSYKVLHIDLLGLHEPEATRKQMKQAKKAFTSPLDKPLDEDSDDEEESTRRARAAAVEDEMEDEY